MPPKKKLALAVKTLLWKAGQNALVKAKQTIKDQQLPSHPLQEALEYFMETWNDVVHPALLALSCEAVGGKAEETTEIGVAYILLAGGADIHDDLIDDSSQKYGRPSVLGKFGKDITILVGDALLFKGLFTLYGAVQKLPSEKQQATLDLTLQAFSSISSAETQESILKNTGTTDPEPYLSMIKIKAAVGEATMRIGAIIGNGSPQEVEALATFGKNFGALMTIRDEYIDLFELEEVKNRSEREWLPLPILYALRDPAKKEEILHLLKAGTITQKAIERTVDIVTDSKENADLKQEMNSMIKESKEKLSIIKRKQRELNLMLDCAIEDI